MNDKPEIIKGFKTVEFFRKVKRRISKKIINMTPEEQIAYFNSAPKIFPRKPGDPG